MKKSRLYPFERNRYFYGKLLTVRDFESEQKYLNDKRRLLNRLLYGSGVVAGMQVVAVDDKTISVQMGVALDYLGREIVIPSPVTLKLSMIEGFTNNEYKKNVYLCVAYDEKGKEPVHSVGNSSVRGDEVSEYNRVQESYRLVVREEAPSPSSFEFVQLMETVATLYQQGGVRITQRMPKYALPGEVVEVKLIVEKTLQTPRISLSYDYEADGFTPVGQSGTKVQFVEPSDAQETEYVLTYHVKASGKSGARSELSVPSAAIALTIGDTRIPAEARVRHAVEISDVPPVDRVLADWYDRSLEQAVEGAADQLICLAKISLLQMGPTYMIEQVERVPFDEYVQNVSLLQRLAAGGRGQSLHKFFAQAEAYELDYGSKPELKAAYHPDRNEFEFKLGLPQPQELYDEIETGLLEVPLESIGKTGGSFFSRGRRNYVSEEIPHGLGDGDVTIIVGQEEVEQASVSADLLQTSKKVYYGNADVFKGTEYEPDLPNVSFGTIVYPDKGTFRIGMKLIGETESQAIRVRWWALKTLSGSGHAVKADLGASSGKAFASEAASGSES